MRKSILIPKEDFQPQKRSLYKNLQGKKWKTSEGHSNIQIGSGQKLSSLIKANDTYLAMPFVGPGIISFKKISNYGKWADKPSHLLYAHQKVISDFAISHFKGENLLLSSASGEMGVKLWELDDSITKPLMKPKLEVNHTEGSFITRVGFHNRVQSLILTGQQNGVVNLFDINKPEKALISASTKNSFDDYCWNPLGTTLVTAHTDKMMRIFDIRAGHMVVETEAQQTIKSFSTRWLNINGTNQILTVGFGKGTREWAVWDPRKVEQALIRTKIDDGASNQIIPYVDEDTNIIYFSGRGDREIKIYEAQSSGSYLEYLTEFKTDSQNASLALLPKDSVKVMEHEVSRFVKVTNEQTVEIVSMNLIRNNVNGLYFQEDVFVDTWDRKSICTVEEYFQLKEDELKVNKVTLKPSEAKSIFEVPVEQGGKLRTPLPTSQTPSPQTPLFEKREKFSEIVKKEEVPEKEEFDEKEVTEEIKEKVHVEETTTKVVTQWNYMFIIPVSIAALAIYRLFYITVPLAALFIYLFGKKKIEIPETTKTEKVLTKTISKKVMVPRGKKGNLHVSTTSHPVIHTEKAQSPERQEYEEPVESDDPRSGPKIMKSLGEFTKEDLQPRDPDPNLKAVEVVPSYIKSGKQQILIMVRGKVPSRAVVVEKKPQNVYSDTSYVLQTNNKIFVYHSKKANKFQKAQAKEIGNTIKHKESSGSPLAIIDEGSKSTEKDEKEFWKQFGLEGRPENMSPCPWNEIEFPKYADSDVRLYEVVETRNKDGEEEITLADVELGERMPEASVLTKDGDNKCFIYSTSSEVFVWTGKKSDNQMKKFSVAIAKKMANKLVEDSNGGFVTFTRVIQDGETTIFKSKFNGFEGSLSINVGGSKGQKVTEKPVQKMVDIADLYKYNPQVEEPLDLRIPGKLLIQRVDMVKKTFLEYPENMYGHFFMSDAYLCVYSYQKTEGGKDWNIVFFWQGRSAKRNVKGAAAFGAVDLAGKYSDATQVRVVQGYEPLNFLQLFAKKYICHQGSFVDQATLDNRIYEVRGNPLKKDTSFAIEIDKFDSRLLKSTSTFLTTTEKPFIWKGSKSTDDELETAVSLSKILKKECQVLEEGKGDEEFFKLFKDKYQQLDEKVPRRIPRLFQLWEANLVEIDEIDKYCQYELSNDLAYIFDCSPYLFVWFGTKCAHNIKKFALEVALEYSKAVEKDRKEKPKVIKIVLSGKEPLEFTSYFHAWTGANSYSLVDDLIDVEKEVVKYQIDVNITKVYTYDFIQECRKNNSFPDGTDVKNLEKYLSPEEFKKYVGCTIEEYNGLKEWKRHEVKTKANLGY